MGQSNYKLIIPNVSVPSNLVVKLHSRTTKEEASKEVGRIHEADNVFDNYEWKIDGCQDGGIKEFNDNLQDQIKQRIDEEEEPEDCLFWDGSKAIFELELYDIAVVTDVAAPLKAESKEEAVKEVEDQINEKNLFNGYDWNIKDCTETGINKINDSLKTEIIERLKEDIQACIKEG
jgi:hypothetical protein